MCGVVGYSSSKPFDVEKIKTLMLWNSLERGEDSTGLYSPKNGLKKSVLKGSEFIVSNAKNFEILPDNIFMAHLRAKTIGAIKVDNAHPFKRGDWVLQHNGTLTNHHDLMKKYDLNYSLYDVDSDVICGALEKTGDLLKVLSEIDGPAALIIQNVNEPNRLYVFKNKERPLFKGTLDGSMFISSIEGSLKLIGCTNVKEFKDDYLYVIEDGLIVKGYPKEIKNKPYKHYYAATNYSKDPQRYLGTILRLPYKTYAHYSPVIGNSVEFLPTDLIVVEKVVNNYITFKKLYGKQEQGEFYLGTFESTIQKYFIDNTCLCKALYDIYLGDVTNTLVKADAVVTAKQRIVNNAVDPENILLYDYFTGKKITYCDRTFVIKLMPDEVIRYNSSIVEKFYNIEDKKPDELPFDIDEDAIEKKIEEENTNNLILFDNTKDQDEEVIPDDTPVDPFYDDLDNHFNKMDALITKVKEATYNYMDHEVLVLLNELDDENFKAQNKFIYEDDEQT